MRYQAYIYVDGYDLKRVAALIKQRLIEMADILPGISVVDDRFERTPDLLPEDLPVWNLGLNFDLSGTSASFLRILLEGIRELSRESGRDFVVGFYDSLSGIDEDIGFIATAGTYDDIVDTLLLFAENGEPGATPTGGPATQPRNSGVSEGPPSVS